MAPPQRYINLGGVTIGSHFGSSSSPVNSRQTASSFKMVSKQFKQHDYLVTNSLNLPVLKLNIFRNTKKKLITR